MPTGLQRTDELSQEQLDQNNARNNARLQALIPVLNSGQPPSANDQALLTAYGYKLENGQVKKMGWWEINKQAVLAAAAVVGGGIALGAMGGASAAGTGASLIGGAGSTAAASGAGLGLAGIGSGAGVSSGLIGGLGTAASLGTGAAAGGGALASSAVPGAGAIGAVPGAGAVSGAGMGGGSSILGTLQQTGTWGQEAKQAGEILTNAAGAQGNARRADNFASNNAAAQNNRALVDVGKFNVDVPGARTSQIARGDLLSQMHDAAPTGDPRIDKFGGGGLRPSAFGPDTHAAGEELKRQALAKLLNGGDQITPQLAVPSKAGKGENIMAGLGMAANLYGQYGKYL